MAAAKEIIFNIIDSLQEEMIELQRKLTSIPAIAPESGGSGETDKARMLEEHLKSLSLGTIDHFDACDARVPSGVRPNIILSAAGKQAGKKLWIMTHTDIVPPGEAMQWQSDPYKLVIKDGKIIGRGVEDNQQSLVASIYALAALQKAGVQPARDIKLLFVADEETGSEYGVKYLVKNHRDLFSTGDLALVPDAGRPDSSMIEVAEKSILWLRVHTTGLQIHASLAPEGRNAFVAASEMAVALYNLKDKFDLKNNIFEPPVSTISPTKKEANIPNINTIPGDDVFYVDCRILPEIGIDPVFNAIKDIAAAIEKKYGVKVDFEIVQKEASPPTPADSAIVGMIQSAVKTVYGTTAVPMGIGGGTVAAHLRREGIHTAVWSTIESFAHMPNETCLVKNMVGDAKVMALLMIGE
ncbi:MAG: M20 family metallo-hydrolase [Spirochaetales bacterium]|nr:M20 family metallo-hydrolase [Spirochaetales bacterium]